MADGDERKPSTSEERAVREGAIRPVDDPSVPPPVSHITRPALDPSTGEPVGPSSDGSRPRGDGGTPSGGSKE